MKIVTILSLLLLASPVFGELTKEDLRTILKEEITASEKRTREYIDLKIETINTRIDALDKRLNGRIDDIRTIMITLIALITAAIAVPQILIAYRDRGQKGLEQAMQSQIDQLRAQIEAMQNTPS